MMTTTTLFDCSMLYLNAGEGALLCICVCNAWVGWGAGVRTIPRAPD